MVGGIVFYKHNFYLINCSSDLQVMRTAIKSWMSSILSSSICTKIVKFISLWSFGRTVM